VPQPLQARPQGQRRRRSRASMRSSPRTATMRVPSSTC
jgi:hypothetical protein